MGRWTKKDIEYMRMALRLAAKATDKTYPNPMVGAVIVKNGAVVGKGYHKKAGCDHAEITAMKKAGDSCRGATMYVTLEPCDHYGKTPPCTGSIINSGIKKVVIASEDLNPLTAAKGIKRLRKAGISVRKGLLREEAVILNRKFNKFITEKMPYVTLKMAQSLDGKIAARDGSSKWISSRASRKFVKNMRETFDAIIVGSGTAAKDDPFLLGPGGRGHDVRRVVMDSRLRIKESSNLIRTVPLAPLTILTTSLAPERKVERFRKIRGIDVITVKSKKGKVSLRSGLRELAGRGVVNALVEGGGELAGSFVDEGLLDEVKFFISPRIIGGGYSSVKGRGVRNIRESLCLENTEYSFMGGDILVTGRVGAGKQFRRKNRGAATGICSRREP
ncbi:MAG: bifunctional diaminohydroxyphosphoribosylaminopyrimidine deaminase/5-amino-6-(5-phosphoribosylamino)uracil reductase RibD [Candidatus Omnitrophica bacterium]|nr:bifunctional diaminohydroxyphosphoribosylaminopyrimidine deaminase/5-amino-6-(5-phosphoribosylamino)uracil reductase RibD [Candidatus Omnitrophota bacterium]